MCPQECQSPPPPAADGLSADAPPGVDSSVVLVGAADRIGADGSDDARDARPADDPSVAFDPLRTLIASGLQGLGRVRDGFANIPIRRPPGWSLTAGAVAAVSFGLGFACAAILTPRSDAPLPDQKVEAVVPVTVPVAPVALAREKPPPRPHRRLAKAAEAKPRSRANASAAAQAQHVEPQTIIMQGMARISAQSPQQVSAESGQPPPVSPVPETKPATIPGWSLREVNGETAVVAGPNQVFTVRAGDAVPGVGRIDSIVRWGDRWIVTTSKGLISAN